jgi:di/tricarboxylate transporter
MSSEVIAAIITILTVVVPLFGFQFDSAQLTAMVQAAVVVISAVYMWAMHLKTKEVLVGRKVNFFGKVV